MPKEKAEEKYNDSIASGNTGFISRYDDNMNNYNVNIGNIKPKQKVKLNTIFLQMIGSQDMSYEFVIMEKYPSFYYKEINPREKTIKANFKLITQSKITRLIAPFLDEEAKNNSKYEVNFSNDYKSAEIKYEKKSINQSKERKKLISFSLLFITENMDKPLLYYQYNPKLKETSY